MQNQKFAARLEALGTGAAATRRRSTLRPKGEELEQHLIALIARIVGSLPGGVPQPAQLFYDFARTDRPRTLTSCGQVIAALANDPRVADAQLLEVEITVSAWLDSLRAPCITPLRTLWSQETVAQADADIAQSGAIFALETRDPCAIARAIDESREHIAHERCLLARLYLAERELAA